jgi:hypothetical protein
MMNSSLCGESQLFVAQCRYQDEWKRCGDVKSSFYTAISGSPQPRACAAAVVAPARLNDSTFCEEEFVTVE